VCGGRPIAAGLAEGYAANAVVIAPCWLTETARTTEHHLSELIPSWPLITAFGFQAQYGSFTHFH